MRLAVDVAMVYLTMGLLSIVLHPRRWWRENADVTAIAVREEPSWARATLRWIFLLHVVVFVGALGFDIVLWPWTLRRWWSGA